MAVLALPAWAQERTRASDYQEIEEVVQSFLTSITESGVSNFKGLAFPCYLIVPGLADGIVVFESEADLDPPGRAPGLETRDLAIWLAGRAAVATFQFQPRGAPTWATATLLLTRPTGIWVLQGITFGANQRPLDADLDMVRALRTSFVSSLTTNGPSAFDGLDFPFLFYNGRSGTVQLIETPGDLPAGGEPLALRAGRIRWAYSDAAATVTMELTHPDQPEAGAEAVALVCAQWESGWHAVVVVSGPSTGSGPDSPMGGDL